MAITRFKEKPKVTIFEGVSIGVREPKTSEMLEITKQRQAFLKSVKDDVLCDGEGETSLFLELQLNTSRLLACDPGDAESPWFASDSEDQKRLQRNGVERDLAEEVPHKFHVAVWNKLIGADGNAPLESPEMDSKTQTKDSEITNDSTVLSSELPSTSDAQSEKSSSGNGDDFSIESTE